MAMLGDQADEDLDPQKGTPAHTGAQLSLVRHFGKKDVGKGLRARKSETDQQQADRDQRVGYESNRHPARGEVAPRGGSPAVGFLFTGYGEMDAQVSLGCRREVSSACRNHGQCTITPPDETMPA
jgi:hypothetical protein